jgi:hypothetical protein
MNKLVEDGIKAAHEGSFSKALEFFNQALNENPRETDALLGMASITMNIEQKRHYFQRVLDIDPTNQIARQAVLEIDRRYIQNASQLPHIDVPLLGKALAFRFMPLVRIGFFLLGISGLIIFWASLIGSAPFYVSLLFLSLGGLFIYQGASISYRVEIDDKGIRTIGLMKNQSVLWENIAEVKGWHGGILLLDQSRTPAVKIHMLVKGYPDIMRIMRLKRADLWSSGDDELFKKNLIPMIFFTLIGGPFLIIGLFNLFRSGQDYFWGGIISIGWGLLFVAIGLGQLGSVKLEGGLLIIRNNIEYRCLAASQIKQIDLQRVTSIHIHGFAFHQFVVIVPVEGKPFRMSGFKDGDEVVYNFLFRWWEKHRNINQQM